MGGCEKAEEKPYQLKMEHAKLKSRIIECIFCHRDLCSMVLEFLNIIIKFSLYFYSNKKTHLLY